jgi:hypothetical protein
MQPRHFDLKTRFYMATTILLFLLVEWVNDITVGVSAIVLFLKGVF